MGTKLYLINARKTMIKYQIDWCALKHLAMIESMWTRIINDARESNMLLGYWNMVEILIWKYWLLSIHRKPDGFFMVKTWEHWRLCSSVIPSPHPSFISLMYPGYWIMKMIYRNPSPDIIWTFVPYHDLLSF